MKQKILKIFLVFSIFFALGVLLWSMLEEDPVVPTHQGAGQVKLINPGGHNSKFVGYWNALNQSAYKTLIVENDSIMMVTTTDQQTLRFKYKIASGKLVMLKDNDMYMNNILTLGNDSLVLNGFMNAADTTTFVRQ